MAFGHVAEIDIGPFGVESLRCAFKITKTIKSSPNTCELSVYNLNAETRAAIQELNPEENSTRGIPVRIRAGYKDEPLFQLWLGDLRSAISIHEPPNWRTILTSGDGEKAFRKSRIAQSFGPRTPVATALRAVVLKLREYLGPNAISDKRLQEIMRSIQLHGSGKILDGGITLFGSAPRVLSSICESAGLEWSIQDGEIQIIDRGATLKKTAIKVKEFTNMIGTPEVDAEGVIKVRTLIVPDLVPGSVLDVESERVNGFYRAEKVEIEGDTFEPNVWHATTEGKRADQNQTQRKATK